MASPMIFQKKLQQSFQQSFQQKHQQKLQYAAISHPGLVRRNNEDNLWMNGNYKESVAQGEYESHNSCTDQRALFAVCDGMGGEAYGEQASLLAVESLHQSTMENAKEDSLRDILQANQKLCQWMDANGGVRSGTTLAALYVDAGRAMSCNLGDSRVYHIRDGQMERLSKDHSQAQRMLDMQVMTEEELRTWPGRHKLTQYIGIYPEEMLLEPFYSEQLLIRDGDIFLLCSDGLTDMLTDPEIVQVVVRQKKPEQIVQKLLEQALAAGGKDNVTIVAVKVTG